MVKYSLKNMVYTGTELAQSVMASVEFERKETKEALQIVNKMLIGKEVTKSEMRFVKAQSVDLLKIVPLVVLAMIPTPIPMVTLLLILGKKYGIDFLPNSHKQAEKRLRRIKMRTCIKKIVRIAEIRINRAASYNRVKGRLSYRFASDDIIKERMNYDKVN